MQEDGEVIDYLTCHKDVLRGNIARFSIHYAEVPREALRFTCSINLTKLDGYSSSSLCVCSQ